jgi:hypothetical protein
MRNASGENQTTVCDVVNDGRAPFNGEEKKKHSKAKELSILFLVSYSLKSNTASFFARVMCWKTMMMMVVPQGLFTPNTETHPSRPSPNS